MAKRIDRVDTRARLECKREPYWQRLSEGRYLGFRKLTPRAPGNWIARFYDGEAYRHKALGDFVTLTERERYDAAKRAADEWFVHLDRGGTTTGGTVKDACEAYVEKLRLEKSEGAVTDAKGRFTRLIYEDPIGRVALAKLAPRHLAEWKKRVIGKGGSRGSFNRNATALRAALNLARQRREVVSDHAWAQELKPFAHAEGRRTLYLDRAARRKLIERAPEEVKPLLTALALLPLRPGDPAKLRVSDLDLKHGVLTVPHGKTAARVIPLGRDALEHFKAAAQGKHPAAWLFTRSNGKPWTKESWRDLIKEAAKAAKLPAATCAYALRGSIITDMVTGGLDLFTVAKVSGTSVVMIERHYGHLQREHARAALDRLALT